MALNIYFGTTSQSIDLFIQDTASTTGGGKTGLVYNTAGLSLWYRIGATGTLTQITLATQTLAGAWSSGGFVEVDATNAPGLYRLDLPNAVLATSGLVTLFLKGTAIVMAPREIDTRPVHTVTNVTNVSAIASQVRSELTAELALLDAAISSRAAPGASMALTSGERLTLAGTIEAEFLNDMTGAAFMSGVIAQITALFDSGADVPIVTIAAAVADQVAYTLLANPTYKLVTNATGQVTVSNTIPTAAQNATQVRAELTTELGRLDAAVSTRLASGSYTTPPTAAAIRTEIDSNSTQIALIPKQGQTHRLRQIAASEGDKTADVAIEAAT